MTQTVSVDETQELGKYFICPDNERAREEHAAKNNPTATHIQHVYDRRLVWSSQVQEGFAGCDDRGELGHRVF